MIKLISPEFDLKFFCDSVHSKDYIEVMASASEEIEKISRFKVSTSTGTSHQNRKDKYCGHDHETRYRHHSSHQHYYRLYPGAHTAPHVAYPHYVSRFRCLDCRHCLLVGRLFAQFDAAEHPTAVHPENNRQRPDYVTSFPAL